MGEQESSAAAVVDLVTDGTPSPSESVDASTAESGGGVGRADQSAPTEPETPDTKKKPLVVPKAMEPTKTGGRFQERISDLVNRRKQLEAENRRLSEEVSTLRDSAKKDAPSRTQNIDPSDVNHPLTPEQFDTYDDYLDARMERKLALREQAQATLRGEQAVAAHRQQRLEAFTTAADPLVEQYGDKFYEAITDPSLPVNDAMTDAVLELDELGPYVMLWLASNKQDAARIARLNPRLATIEIGRLAARLDNELRSGQGASAAPAEGMAAGAVKPRPSVIQTPRGGSPSSIGDLPSDRDDPATWLDKERARLRAKYGPHARFY